MKEKANYPKNTKNNKIDHFLAFRRKAKSNGYYNKLADSGQSNGEWACVGRFAESSHLLMDLMCALCWPAISCLCSHTQCLDRVGGKLEINLPHAQIHPLRTIC